MKTQLLCTFTTKNNLNDIINLVIECNTIVFDKIYVCENGNDSNQLICTYNVEYEEDFIQGSHDTISLHRKKMTNTLYTINALNDLIRELNGGKLDKSYQINWEDYQNCLLLTNENGLNKIPTKIHKIIDTKTFTIKVNFEHDIANSGSGGKNAFVEFVRKTSYLRAENPKFFLTGEKEENEQLIDIQKERCLKKLKQLNT